MIRLSKTCTPITSLSIVAKDWEMVVFCFPSQVTAVCFWAIELNGRNKIGNDAHVILCYYWQDCFRTSCTSTSGTSGAWPTTAIHPCRWFPRRGSASSAPSRSPASPRRCRSGSRALAQARCGRTCVGDDVRSDLEERYAI